MLLLFIRRCVVLLLLVTVFLFANLSVAQISLSPNQTAQALAQKLSGPGITVLNATLTCTADANGFFKFNNGPLGIDSGILLTTGRAATAGAFYGVNGSEGLLASINNGTPGDPQLNTLANNNTVDACKLEFDLIPKGENVQFDYVFGSEEYNNATCGPYNDAFAFFISGPGITGQDNMALVPGTNIPVTVNTINSGIPGSQGNIANCTSMGPGSPFTNYYYNNTGGTMLTYKGFTKVLRAQHAVQPCSTYHLKLTIADGGNGLYDSGVFIKAGSLETTSISAAASGAATGSLTPTVYRACASGRFAISRSQKKPQAQWVKFQIGGTAVNGVDYTQIPDSVQIPANDSVGYISISALATAAGGARTVTIYVYSPYACNGPEIADSATIQILDHIDAHILTADTVVCAGAGFRIRVDGDPGYDYNWTPGTDLDNAQIESPTVTPTANTTYIMTVTLPGSGCSAVNDTFQVTVHQRPEVSAGEDQKLCAHSADVQLNGTVNPTSPDYTYQWSGPNGFSANTINATLAQPDAAATGYYVFSVFGEGCASGVDSVMVTVLPTPSEPELPNPLEICLNGNPPKDPGGTQSLLWYQEPSGGIGNPQMPTVDPTVEALYTYYVSQTSDDGCESPRRQEIIHVEKCCEDQVFIPTAFSPNGDGRNDHWVLHKGPDDVVLQALVFNRWGQVVYEGRNQFDWDGTFQGQKLDSGTYFYDVLISCSKGKIVERKGDLLLLR